MHSRGPRSRRRAGAAGFAAAALAVLVVLALAAPERRAAPRSGAFAAAGRMVSPPAPGAVPGRPSRFALRFTVGGRHPRLTAVRLHSVLACRDGRAIADDVAIPLASGAAVPRRGAFAVEAAGVRLRGFFISPDRAIGSVTRAVGHCAARVQWTARPVSG